MALDELTKRFSIALIQIRGG